MKNIKPRLKNNKTIVENFLSLSTINVISYIFPIIILSYITKVLGVEKYGQTTFVLSIMQYFILFSNYGFSFSATKEISINRNNINKVSKIFSSIIAIKTIITIISLIILMFLIIFVDSINKEKWLYIMSFGVVIGNIFIPVWLFQGLEKMKYITITIFISKLVFTLLIFVVIKDKSDYIFFNLLNSIGQITAGIVSIFIVCKILKVKFIFVKLQDIKEQLKQGYHIFLSTISMNFYRESNTFLLGLLTNYAITGYYSAAEKIIKSIQSIMSPIAESLFPNFSRRFAMQNIKKNIADLFRIAKYYSLILIFISIFTLIFTDLIIKIVLDDNFLQIANTIRIMLAVVFFGGLNYLFGIVGLINLNYSKYFTFAVFCSGVIGILILILLANIYGYIAGGIAMSMSEITLFAMIFYKLKKLQNG